VSAKNGLTLLSFRGRSMIMGFPMLAYHEQCNMIIKLQCCAYYRPDALPATQPTASKHWRPVKWVVGCWQSWCHCHSLSLAPVNPDWFYLPGFTSLVPAHPGSPRQSATAFHNKCLYYSLCSFLVVVILVTY